MSGVSTSLNNNTSWSLEQKCDKLSRMVWVREVAPPVQQALQGTVGAKPFLKWAGGKRQIIGELRSRVPARFGTYHEPFLGGGALFFAMMPPKAILSDTNERLVRAYRGVQQEVESVVEQLSAMPPSREFFLSQRQRLIDLDSDVDASAWMIYLNHTAYNGLYRVNKSGRFNTPFGRYTNPTICDAERLRACSSALSGAALRVQGFEQVLDTAAPGDFVYFDPPYVPISVNASFTRYTPQQFKLSDHERLRDTALELKRGGVHVLLSNSDAAEVLALYERDFTIDRIQATRMVNSDPRGRGRVTETLIT